jgi:hypothetical protein
MSSRYNGQQSAYTKPSTTQTLQSQGWQQTGANNGAKVEFYERGDVKMDYYPTTGTVKTSMAHPKQGNTQMFRRGLDHEEFSNVAYNPRSHTGKGYQTKRNSDYYDDY